MNEISNGWILFSCFSFRVVLPVILARCHTVGGLGFGLMWPGVLSGCVCSSRLFDFPLASTVLQHQTYSHIPLIPIFSPHLRPRSPLFLWISLIPASCLLLRLSFYPSLAKLSLGLPVAVSLEAAPTMSRAEASDAHQANSSQQNRGKRGINTSSMKRWQEEKSDRVVL